MRENEKLFVGMQNDLLKLADDLEEARNYALASRLRFISAKTEQDIDHAIDSAYARAFNSLGTSQGITVMALEAAERPDEPTKDT